VYRCRTWVLHRHISHFEVSSFIDYITLFFGMFGILGVIGMVSGHPVIIYVIISIESLFWNKTYEGNFP